MVFKRHFKKNQLYRGSLFYWWRKPEYPEKTKDPPQVTDKSYHIMLHSTCTVADLEGGVRGVRGVCPPKIRKAYVIQR